MYKISLRNAYSGTRIGCLKNSKGKLATFKTWDEAVAAAKLAVAEGVDGEAVNTEIMKIREERNVKTKLVKVR